MSQPEVRDMHECSFTIAPNDHTNFRFDEEDFRRRCGGFVKLGDKELAILSERTINLIKEELEQHINEQKNKPKSERPTKYGTKDPKERAKLYLKTYTEKHPEYVIAQRERARARYYRLKEIKAQEKHLALLNKELEQRSEIITNDK